jgi:hypothetical protein
VVGEERGSATVGAAPAATTRCTTTPPATRSPADGFQLSTTTFDLAPVQEFFNCFHLSTPNDGVYGASVQVSDRVDYIDYRVVGGAVVPK